MSETPRQQIDEILEAIYEDGKIDGQLQQRQVKLPPKNFDTTAILAVFKGLPAMQEEVTDYADRTYLNPALRNELRHQILAELDGGK